jgi:hypothetical protein
LQTEAKGILQNLFNVQAKKLKTRDHREFKSISKDILVNLYASGVNPSKIIKQ